LGAIKNAIACISKAMTKSMAMVMDMAVAMGMDNQGLQSN